MSLVQYLCEFFFCDFLHFLELLCIVGLMPLTVKVIEINKEKKGDKE